MNGTNDEKREDSDAMQQRMQDAQTRWYHKITVEPTMVLYMLAFMLTSVVEQVFFVYKACIANHNYPHEICKNIQNYDAIKREVQITVSNFHQWNNIGGHVIPIILALFLGAWSDKRGRKYPLVLGLIGKLYYSIMIVVNANNPSWSLEMVVYTATIPSALTGADVAIFACAFAYISDVSTVADRTIRITILDVCYLATIPIGVALGAYIFNLVDNSFSIMFTINSAMLALSIIYSIFRLKAQTTEKQRSIWELKWHQIPFDYFDRQHVKKSLVTLTKYRPERRRLFLLLLLAGMFFYTFQRDEKPMLFLYTQLIFNWNADDYSYFKTFQSTAYVITMLLGIPFMAKVLKMNDTGIIMVGAMAHAVSRLFFGFAQVWWVIYLGALFASLGPVVGPVLRSMISKTVPLSERGIAFALLSVCDNAVPLFSGVLYTQVYNASIHTHPTAIFWMTIGTQILVMSFIGTIHYYLKGENLQAPMAETSENLDKTETNGISKVPIADEDPERMIKQ